MTTPFSNLIRAINAKVKTEHPYDQANRQYNEILAGKKTYWECLEEIINKEAP